MEKKGSGIMQTRLIIFGLGIPEILRITGQQNRKVYRNKQLTLIATSAARNIEFSKSIIRLLQITSFWY